MAKKSSLLSEITKLPDRKPGKPTWIDRFVAEDPELYEEVSDIVDRWLDGDQGVRRKLPTQASLCDWLSPLLAERGRQVAAQTCQQMFVHRRAVRNAKDS